MCQVANLRGHEADPRMGARRATGIFTGHASRAQTFALNGYFLRKVPKAPNLKTLSARVPVSFVGAFQNRKTMCYAAGVAESGGLDRMVRIFGSRSDVREFPCRAHLEVLQSPRR